jgi:hypothetical protein
MRIMSERCESSIFFFTLHFSPVSPGYAGGRTKQKEMNALPGEKFLLDPTLSVTRIMSVCQDPPPFSNLFR